VSLYGFALGFALRTAVSVKGIENTPRVQIRTPEITPKYPQMQQNDFGRFWTKWQEKARILAGLAE
jgi:hypothetical protein